ARRSRRTDRSGGSAASRGMATASRSGRSRRDGGRPPPPNAARPLRPECPTPPAPSFHPADPPPRPPPAPFLPVRPWSARESTPRSLSQKRRGASVRGPAEVGPTGERRPARLQFPGVLTAVEQRSTRESNRVRADASIVRPAAASELTYAEGLHHS